MLKFEDNYLKDCITSSLLILMKTTPYDKITMSMIAKKSGFSRRTIYRYFDNKQNIMLNYMQKLKEEYTKYVKDDILQGKLIVEKSFQFILDNFDYFKVAYNNKMFFDIPFILEDIIRNVVKSSSESNFTSLSEDYINYYVSFVVGGCVSMLKTWIENKDKTPAEMYDIYKTIVKDLNTRLK